MKANELLFWLSARRKGSWRQYRDAVEKLHSDDIEILTDAADGDGDGEYPLYQRLRDSFEYLAHVEFFARGCEDGWRVVPPMIAAHPTTCGIRAVLCGARSPGLRERLIRGAENLTWESLNPFGVPEVVRFIATDVAAFAKMTEETGLYFQTCAPLAILSHLPPCDPPSRRQKPAEFPTGDDWNIHEFDASALAWAKTERGHAKTAHMGMFRFTHRFHRPSYLLRWSGATFRMPRAVGLYVLLKRSRQDLLTYDRSTQTLRVPAICRPPRLLERALVLCSGLPPAYDAAVLTYVDIPPEIASHAAELLRQPLL